MKQLLLFTAIVCAFASCKSTKPQAFIKQADLIDHLDKEYAISAPDDKSQYRLTKMRDGWHIQQFRTGDKNAVVVVKDELCWSAAKKSFVPVTIFPKEGQGAENYPYFRANRAYDVTDRVPYYGYEGWAKDVIADFSGASDDTTLEALGRAYENYAEGFLDHRGGFELPEQRVGSLDERVVKYQENMDKALEAYRKLEKQNPHYEVIVGEIHTKYSNSMMTAWMDLSLAGKEALAKNYVKEKLYDPLMLSVARSILNSCPKDAILFTYGDNDTFPLWYLQQAEGVRPDVHVVNESLLNVANYIHAQYKSGLTFTIDQGVYENQASEYIVVNPANVTEDMRQVSEWVDVIGRMAEVEAFPGSKEKTYQLADAAIRLHFPKVDTTTNTDFDIRLKRSYIFRSDLAKLDLIFSNIDKHPICYSEFSPRSDFNLDELKVTRSHHIQLVSPALVRTYPQAAFFGVIDTTEIWNGFNSYCKYDTASTDRHAGAFFVRGIRLNTYLCAGVFAATSPAKAYTMLQTLDKQFPDKVWANDQTCFYGFEAYCKMGKLKEAEQQGRILIDRTLEEVAKAKSDEHDQEVERAKSIFQMLSNKARESKLDALANDAEAKIGKLK